MDAYKPGGQAGVARSQAIESLTHDHRYVRQLFDRYLNTQDMDVKREAGPEIIRALQTHVDLEEAVFYPRVRSVDPALVDHNEQEHQEARQLMEQIKGIDATHPQCDELMRQLAQSILHHIDNEEQQLFPKVQQSGLDLEALGLEMQSYESNIVSSQARATQRPGLQS